MVKATQNIKAPDFKALLKAELAKRCRKNPKFSLRAFAKMLGTDSSSLSKILSGKRGLSRANFESFSEILGLMPEEKEKFLLQELDGILNDSKGSEFIALQCSSEDQIIASSDWLHVAMLEATKLGLTGGLKVNSTLAKRFNVSVHEVDDAISRLVRLGMLESDGQGFFKEAKAYSTLNLGVTSAPLRRRQTAFIEKSLSALEECPADLRDHSGLTLAFSLCDLAAVKEFIRRFRRDFNAKFSQNNEADLIYQLNIQFFPLENLSLQKSVKEKSGPQKSSTGFIQRNKTIHHKDHRRNVPRSH